MWFCRGPHGFWQIVESRKAEGGPSQHRTLLIFLRRGFLNAARRRARASIPLSKDFQNLTKTCESKASSKHSCVGSSTAGSQRVHQMSGDHGVCESRRALRSGPQGSHADMLARASDLAAKGRPTLQQTAMTTRSRRIGLACAADSTCHDLRRSGRCPSVLSGLCAVRLA